MTSDGDRIADQVRQWRDDLIDLSRRNRLLSATGRRTGTMRILEPAVDEILDRLGTEGSARSEATSWRFHYPPSEDLKQADAAALAALHAEDSDISDEREHDELLTDVTSALDLSKKLRALERRASSEYMDKGLRVLYLGIGVLRWREVEDEWLESPIVMRPVTLVRRSPRDPFRLVATDDDIVVNPALAVKLDNAFNITIPEFDDTGDITTTLDAVRVAVDGQPGWQLHDEALFGAFSFHKEAMYRDLLKNEASVLTSVLVRAVAGDLAVADDLAFDPVPDDQLDDVAPPEQLAAILDCDSTQRQCIVAARDGRTFVMDGPPGTGKSQTIANVIAELIAAEKTVLFVSEKAAALEVVHKRLQEAHLDSYVLELHSSKATRKEVAKALGAALTERPRPQTAVTGEDLRRAVERRNRLSAYAAAQNDTREPFGKSLHWAIGRRAQLEEALETPPPESIDETFTGEQYAEALDAARVLADSWGPVERRQEFLWRDLNDADGLRARRSQVSSDLASTITDLERAADLGRSVTESLHLEPPTTLTGLHDLSTTLRLIERRAAIPIAWLTNPDPERRVELIAEAETQARALGNAVARLDSRSNAWRSLHPDADARMTAIAADAAALVPALDLARLDTSALASLCDLLVWLEAEGDGLAEAGRTLESALGLNADTTPHALRTVTEVATLGLAPHRPEKAWLESAGLEAARRAIATLRPLVETYRTLAGQVSTTFNESAFQLDIESFYGSPTDVTPNLSRLSSSGRENRRKLRACSQSGKVDSDVTSMLPSLRQWHQLATQLAAAEASEAAALGVAYYQSIGTDFDSVVTALDVAQRALQLLGVASPPELLRSQLSRTSVTADHLAAEGSAVGQRLNQWTATLEQYAAYLPAALHTMPCDAVAAWARSAAPTLRSAVALVEDNRAAIANLATLGDLHSLCTDATIAIALEEWFSTASEALASELGPLYQRQSTDWDGLRRASEWATEVIDRIGPQVTGDTALALLTLPLPTDEYEQSVSAASKRLAAIPDWFGGQQRGAVATELGSRIDDAVEFITDLRDNLAQLDEWASFQNAIARLEHLGLRETIGALVERAIDRSAIRDAVDRAILTSWLDAVLGSDPRCEPFRADDRDRLVAEFRELDHLIVSHATARVIDAANRHRPATAVGEFGLIRTESEKKTRHRPIKTLLEEAGRAAQALTPCFMMSPLTVSQFLPPDLRFDAVIFDEASQVRPGDAVGAIYRGRQLIVAGDNKQLPPTAFFDRSGDDTTDEFDPEAFDVFESLLDLCRGAASVPELPLRWHYRSRHESLITYSNRAFYGGHLVTFPGPDESGPSVGVQLIHVPDGVYQRGSSRDNPIEARRVVERILHHADEHPDMTLGVVAFSEAQATRIQLELEAARRDRSDLDDYFHEDRLDGFFIKNLETVQGDERDVIIFSIGYGYDEVGKFLMNFGPINKDGGQRRLNVAITRARSRVEVVASVKAGDFKDSTNLGVKHLKGYLDYAERGEQALPLITLDGGEPESPFEEDVLDTIRGWGFEAEPQVGHAGYRIDIGIRNPSEPGRWLIGVECDGAAYHSSRTARDRDRLRQQVLENLGWRLHRIWGPSWYRDRRGTESRLREAIDRALNGIEEVKAQTAARVAVAIDEVDTDDLAPPDWVGPYIVATVQAAPPGCEPTDAVAQSALRAQVAAVVEVEGPVHRDLIVERLKAPWGIARARTRFRGAVNEAIDTLVAQRACAADGPFISVYGRASDNVRVPEDEYSGPARSIDMVPPAELQAALLRLVTDARGIEQTELAMRVARLFGWRRTTQPIVQALDTQIATLVSAGKLDRSASGKITPLGADR